MIETPELFLLLPFLNNSGTNGVDKSMKDKIKYSFSNSRSVDPIMVK